MVKWKYSQSTDSKMTDGHTNCAVDEQWSTPGLVNEQISDAGENDEKGVLDARRYQVDVAA